MIRTASAVRRNARLRRTTLLSFLAVMGPGIITGFAGNDAGEVVVNDQEDADDDQPDEARLEP